VTVVAARRRMIHANRCTHSPRKMPKRTTLEHTSLFLVSREMSEHHAGLRKQHATSFFTVCHRVSCQLDASSVCLHARLIPRTPRSSQNPLVLLTAQPQTWSMVARAESDDMEARVSHVSAASFAWRHPTLALQEGFNTTTAFRSRNE
jgi:hypothetical protein